MTADTVYRVTVRGRFAGLDERTRAYLVREQPEHDIFKSAYTTEGTFTYDTQIQFFNLRYEVRTAGGSDKAGEIGQSEAEAILRTLGYGFEKIKVNVVDASAMWKTN